MNSANKWFRISLSAFTFSSCLSSLPVIGIIVSGMAWNGTNLAVDLYLGIAAIGTIGLLLGTILVLYRRNSFYLLTGISGSLITLLCSFFLLAFVFARDKDVQLNDRLGVGPINIPLIAWYVLAIIPSSIIAVFCLREVRRLTISKQ